MRSSKPTIEGALQDFQLLRNCSPFRFSGKWFVAAVADGFVAYRTKAAAVRHSDRVWVVTF